jgi:hypothetical protein
MKRTNKESPETYDVRGYCENCGDKPVFTLPRGEAFDRGVACPTCGCAQRWISRYRPDPPTEPVASSTAIDLTALVELVVEKVLAKIQRNEETSDSGVEGNTGEAQSDAANHSSHNGDELNCAIRTPAVAGV